MAFNFGGNTGNTGGGFSFGTPNTTAAPNPSAPAAGFSFAAKPPTSASTGFSFGTPASTKPAAATGSLTFGTPTTQLQLTKPATQATGGGLPTGGLGVPQPVQTGGFGFGGVPQGTAAPAAASTGFTLGGTSATLGVANPTLGGTSVAPTATAGLGVGSTLGGSGGFTLGGAKPPTGAGDLTTSATSGFSLSGGGLKLGGTATAASAAATTTGGLGIAAPLQLGVTKPTAPTGLTLSTPASSAATGFKLGGVGTAPATGLGTGFGAATSTAAVAPSGSTTFGTTTTTTKPVTFGMATAATTTAVSLSTATSTTASGASVPTMNYRQLEEAINKWTIELEEQEKIFLQQATQVNAWDRLLIDNGEKITQLNTDVERVKIDQQRLDHELDFILAQQGELEALLDPLEKSIEQLPPVNYQQHANPEREHTYQLAENIDAQLKRMVQDLKEIIDHLNTANSNQDSNDPVHQIGKILNAHMDSLQWVDQNTSSLQRRVDEVAKLAELRRKEQERNFRLAYD